LFHRYSDGTERPIANISKTLTESQRDYSQIQKEALAIIYALKKFFQYLYGRKFILVTVHQPLVAMFGLNKPTPLSLQTVYLDGLYFFDNSTTPSSTARRQNTPMLMSSVDCQ